ncbi:hypothetical protein [Lacipirellula sp.]|uniref:hypothetical protein n=1 Tax=Lacipirellula sp. TaxID=2691419 RepID=UPI003D126511
MHNLSDNQLLAAWRSGSRLAEAHLIYRHRAALLASIVRRIGDIEAAERIADAAFADAREHFNPITESFFCRLLHVAQKESEELVPPIIKLAAKYMVPGYDVRDAAMTAALKAKLLLTPEGRASVAKWKRDDDHPLRELLNAIDDCDDPFELGLVSRYLAA